MSQNDLLQTQRQHLGNLLETDYQRVAEHFNTLHALRLTLYAAARKFLAYCADQLAVVPASQDFAAEFARTTAQAS